MKIGFFLNEFLPSMGGAQVTTHCLATSLVENENCNVTVITRKKLYNKCKNNKWNFKYNLLPCNPPSSLIFNMLPMLWLWILRNKFRRVLIKEKFDVVQIIMTWPWMLAANEAKRLGIPVLIRAAGEDIQIFEGA